MHKNTTLILLPPAPPMRPLRPRPPPPRLTIFRLNQMLISLTGQTRVLRFTEGQGSGDRTWVVLVRIFDCLFGPLSLFSHMRYG